MAFLNICGFETGDFSEAYSVSGSGSIQGTIKRTGAYALRCTAAGSALWTNFGGLSSTGVAAALGLTTVYATVYVYLVAYADMDYLEASANGNRSGQVAAVKISAAGEVTINGNTGSSSAGTISLGTWNRIDAKFVTNGTCLVKLNGGTEQSCSGVNNTINYIGLGVTGAYTADAVFDDIAISDSAYPGAGEVRILKPTAFYTTWWGGSVSGINDVPNDGDTGYINSAGVISDYNIFLTSAATGGVGGTIGTVKSVAIARDTGAASGFQTNFDGGTYTTAVDPGATYTPICQLRDTNPNTSAAWTTSGIDSLVLYGNATTTSTIRVTAIYAMVWCTGAVAAIAVGRRSLLGVGV